MAQKTNNPGAVDASGDSVDDLRGSNRTKNSNSTNPQQQRIFGPGVSAGTAIPNGDWHVDTMPPGPFPAAAVELARAGLAVIPVGGDDGKKPLVKWVNWRSPLGPQWVADLCRKFPTANIGIITGLSGITVVDCDDPGVVTAMMLRCGKTPLQTSTPSGGTHLWYRSRGERCGDLRNEGLAVDVKGRGGFVVVPPSIRPSGAFAGRKYDLQFGSWADLEHLPMIRAGALPRTMYRDTDSPTPLRAVKQGHRNRMLFRTLLRHALHCDTQDALQYTAETINDDFDPPLSFAELQKIVKSAWHYEQTGQNWVGREARTVFTAAELQIIEQHPHGADALLLLMKLRLSHGARDGFCVVPKAMARDKVLPWWGKQRYRNAAAALVQLGQLRVTHQGGRRAGDPRRYVFADVRGDGAESETQGQQ